ncbi:DUF559 domain-containing protein [uncultured Jatrophihabitans sp.]|uniref:DUF559 domain-containing protein n=1 Tax=uncultured Jatrophihabitans sp. TaxID=1610747 RepID=UPI0035CC83F5
MVVDVRPERYFDHELGVGRPGPTRVGPAQERQAQWVAVERELRECAEGTELGAAVDLACRQGFALRRDQARRCGVSEAVLRRLVRRAGWTAPRYGVLSPLPPAPRGDTAAPPSAHEVRPCGSSIQVRAAACALARRTALVSHESAAAMHGLPTFGAPDRPTLSGYEPGNVAARDDVIVRCVGRRPEELTEWFGVPVTTAARTVVDVARNAGVAAGLVCADAALHDGLVTHGQLATARQHARYRPGVRFAERVLELTDGRAESPLESLVRLCLVDGGLPVPDLQQWIDTDRGRFRVDLLYRARRVVLEADGELKYVTDPMALVEEKRRQEALERAGFVVVRVMWSDVIRRPVDVCARVARALRS